LETLITKLNSKDKKDLTNFVMKHRNDTELKFFTRWNVLKSRNEIEKFVKNECNKKTSDGIRIIARTIKGDIIGYGLVDFFKTPSKRHVGIVGTFVDKSTRGKGVGKQLLLKEIEVGKKHNLKKLRATIHEHNIQSTKLHLSCGFRIEGRFVAEEFDGRYRNVLSLALFFR
jgi:L-amino acid N-acyltransferase YncA